MTRTVALLIYPGFQLLDVAGPLAAFEAANMFAPASYALRVIALASGPVASSCGAALLAEAPARLALDTLIVSGGCGKTAASLSPEMLQFVRKVQPHTRRTASICTGAFILAAAGLLDGRRATTHWAHAQAFADAFPRIRAEADKIFIRDGDLWTSAGITAGIDLALAMIADDLGEPIAKSVAQQLVVYWRRPAGQSQFSALLDISPSARFANVMAWAREHLHEKLTVEKLADIAAMSPRHFARAFAAEAGLTPAKAVERLRLDVARDQIENGGAPFEAIAVRTGFSDPDRMRRAFLRGFGQSPQALRRIAREHRSQG